MAQSELGFVSIDADLGPIRLLGVGVRAPRDKQESMVHDLACRTWGTGRMAGVVLDPEGKPVAVR